jgi:hypothetical protein
MNRLKKREYDEYYYSYYGAYYGNDSDKGNGGQAGEGGVQPKALDGSPPGARRPV